MVLVNDPRVIFLDESTAGLDPQVRLSKAESKGALKNLEGVADAREMDGTYVLYSMRPPQAIVLLVKHLEAEGNELVSLEIATPSLEDVFIEMTGRRLRD